MCGSSGASSGAPEEHHPSALPREASVASLAHLPGYPWCNRGAAQQVFPLSLLQGPELFCLHLAWAGHSSARSLSWHTSARHRMHAPGTRAKMSSIFAYQSSEVDWCESNFQHSELVAEFFNTFSNVFFLIFGPLIMFLMHPYAQKRTRAIYGVSALFMVVGLFSMYFHMTLSFLGQMLDEISILWLLASGYSVWMPRCYFPKFTKGNRFYFSCLVVLTTMISTSLTFVKPTVNAYALNSIAIHILYIVRKEYKKTSNGDLRHMIEMSVILWAMSLTSWISDRILCSFWQRIHFFYLHSIWHVLISITFPYGIVTMALVDAKYEMPDQTLKIHYWPRDSWPIGLPYVEIQDNDKSC